MESLTAEQKAQLDMFNEVTAHARDEKGSIQLLQACNWNVEQALTLHWTAGEDGTLSRPSTSSAPTTGVAGDLGAPLLNPDQGNQLQGDRSPGGSSAVVRPGVFGRLMRGVLNFGGTIIHLLCTFVFGGANTWINNGAASGGLLRRALTTQYGPQVQFPNFFEGSFVDALAAARRDVKLLVVYLHSEHGRYTQTFCTQVLTNEFVRQMLDSNFLVWGGDIARMETHRVAQMIHARQYPCFAILLPASIDEIRVIGALNGDIQVDATITLLTSCMEEMDMHRSEIVARQEQHAEDRILREDQDREYQEALEMDRRRTEEAKLEEEKAREAARIAEEEQRKEQEEADRLENERVQSEERRKRKASELETPGPDAKARICIRLPAGQKVERKFLPEATLADVYDWADCLPYLSENIGKDLEVPKRFMLKTSFPSRDLTEMEKTVQDLQLAGAVVMLAEIEED